MTTQTHKRPYYRVTFMDIHSGELATLCYKSAVVDHTFGMLRLTDPWFQESSVIILKDEGFKDRFSKCLARYVPLQFVLGIEEVEAPTEGRVEKVDDKVVAFNRSGASK